MTKTHLETVKEYYGKVLQSKDDLKSSACCSAERMPDYLKPIAATIHPEVSEKFYGCGAPFPLALAGCTVLDLGCGTGRDCFMLAKLVGPEGRVIGVDMTESQLEVARKHTAYHMERFGYTKPNVDFRLGYIEDLAALDIPSDSVDVIVSNCVFNLSPAKDKVFAEALRVLKPGGEIYFSDVFVDRRLASELKTDPVLLGECLGGALYVEDFRRLVTKLGCSDHRIVSKSSLSLHGDISRRVGNANFHSATIRVFKLPLEDRCEDYGQVAYYKGTVAESPHSFLLDDHHLFEKDRPMTVCSNTAAMLANTRFAPHFRVEGDLSQHFGLFPCGPAPAAASGSNAPSGSCC